MARSSVVVQVPTSLAAAVASPSTPYDVVALLVARELDDRVDVDAELAALDRLAAPLGRAVRPGVSPAEHARALSAHVAGDLGIVGDHETYDDPDNSHLPRVLARRKGLPITLSVLYAAMGRRAGVTVHGIGFPGHFLVRVGGPDGVLQDPFHAGRLLDREGLAALARDQVGPHVPVSPALLPEVDALALATRMLHNLVRAYEARGDLVNAFVAANGVCSITDHPDPVRIRGELALRQGWSSIAAHDLETYLERSPKAPDAARVHDLLQRARRTRGDGARG